MTDRWYEWPIFWPLWGLLALIALPVVLLLPGELTALAALPFTTPHRAVVFGGVGEIVGIAVLMLGLVGGMIVESE